MAVNVGQWIESVREKPEHIRLRYVMMCVALSMVFILGIWLLTVSESFHSVSSESGKAVDGAREIIPKPSGGSLDEFLQGKESLGTQKEGMSGQQYFDNASQNKTQPNFKEEGVQPVADPQDTTNPSGSN